jgi:exopolysaccharide biosynthesis protein
MVNIRKTSLIIKRGFLFLSILLILTSCASGSPIGTAQANPVVFPAIGAVEPQWQLFEGEVGYFHGKIASPQLEFWALRIDLASPNTRIVVSGGTANQSGSLSARVSSFVRGNNLIAGINALPFDIITSREGQPIKNLGLVISGGKLISPANPYYDALVFYKNGNAAIVKQSETGPIENIENAAGGFYRILASGEAAQRTQNREDRHPRSAAGISANGTYLYLLVIDGRRSDSGGATERETSLLLRAIGSWNGINFDGGGSSALAMRYPDGSVRTVNTPIHNGIPGRERAVAGCIGVSLSKGR